HWSGTHCAPARSPCAPWTGRTVHRTGAQWRWGGSDHAVEAVSGVAEAGDDVGVLVEALVHGGGDDLDLTARPDRLLHGPQALGCDEQADGRDVAGAAVEEVLDRRDERVAGREHGVQDEDLATAEVLGQPVGVGDRL